MLGPEPAHPRLRVGARLAYVVVVLLATVTTLHANADLDAAAFRLRRALSPAISFRDVLDAVRNVALFAGLGVVWAVTTRSAGRWQAVWRATLAGLALSVTVETAQLFSPVRLASVLDVATNGAGALIGAWLTTLVVRAAAGRRTVGALADAPAFLLTLPYVGAAACEAFSSWGRPDAVPGAFGGPAIRWPMALAYSRAHLFAPPTWTDAALFFPAGALAALWLAERRLGRHAGWTAAIACAVLWIVAETARGVAGGDMRPLSVVWRIAWSTLGAVIAGVVATHPTWHARLRGAPRHPGEPRARVSLGVALYALVVLLWSWRPFELEVSLAAVRENLSAQAFVPLAAYREVYNLYTVADVAIDFLLYLPLGAWLCVRPLRRRGWLAGPLPGIWLAVIAELGQVFVAERTFDVTDLLIHAAGVACGWAVLRQADRARARAAQSAEGKVSGGSVITSHAGARSSGVSARVSSK